MANEEAFTLDGLALNDGTTLAIDASRGVDMSPPRQRQDWIGAADSEDQKLVRTPLHENRKITLPLIVVQQSTMDLAHDKILLVLDKLQKAARYEDGIALTWTPSTGTRTVTFDVLAGEIVGLPVDWENGWLSKSPTFSIELTCKPYWRGSETLTSTASSSTPFVTLEVPSVTGDVDALGRLIVTDTATQNRRHVEWGLEGPLTYNSGTSLIIDSDSMVTSGFSGAQEVLGGAYDPNASGNSAITSLTYVSPVALCGTGNQSHVGVFRVKGRFAFSAGDVSVRLSWKAGDGPMVSNEWVPNVLGAVGFQEFDLGTITVPAATVGSQRWTGQIEAYSPGGTGPGVHLDYLILVPTSDGYGKARGAYRYSPGVIVGIDQFTSTTSGSALNGRSAPSGGTWATSGSATDFTFADLFSAEQLRRATVSDTGPRWAVLGSTNYTDTQVDMLYRSSDPLSGGSMEMGAVARWVDSNNYLRATVYADASSKTLNIVKRVAGVETLLASMSIVSGGAGWASGYWWAMRLIVFASGRVLAYLLDPTKTTIYWSLEATDSALATGGALDDGKPGIYDISTWSTVLGRYYDDFVVATPPAEPIALYSGRNMQIRYDDVIRQDSSGTYTGRPSSYRGSRFTLPVGTSRVLVKAKRNDVEAAADDQVTDALQIQVGWTPRGLAVPR